MRWRHLCVAVLALAATACDGGSQAGRAGQPPPDPAAPAARAPAAEPQGRQAVSIDVGALSRFAQPVGLAGREETFPLGLGRFGRVNIQFTSYEQRRDSMQVWSGIVRGAERSRVALTRLRGRVSGVIISGDSVIGVRALGGRHFAEQLDLVPMGSELPPLPATQQATAPPGVYQAYSEERCPERTIDVLQVVLAGEIADMGGLTAVREEFQNSLTISNMVLKGNRISMEFRNAGTAVVNWTAAPSGLEARLHAMQGNVVPNLAKIRNDSAADLVSMWVPQGGDCGIAYLLGPTPGGRWWDGFAVVAQYCATGHHTQTHELGHLLGIAHDPASAALERPRPVPARDYAYGFKHAASGRSDMMTPGCSGSCYRQQYYSTPLQSYGTYTLGDAKTADGARTIRETACDVARYRKRAP